MYYKIKNGEPFTAGIDYYALTPISSKVLMIFDKDTRQRAIAWVKKGQVATFTFNRKEKK